MLDPDTQHYARHAIPDDGVRINRMAIAAILEVAVPLVPRHSAAHREQVAA